MNTLQKATLTEISRDEKPVPKGQPVPVQFNPASMKLQISNSTEGGVSLVRQTRQYLGTSSTVMTVDLIFDKADEGPAGRPRAVRVCNDMVEKFVLPDYQDKDKQGL